MRETNVSNATTRSDCASFLKIQNCNSLSDNSAGQYVSDNLNFSFFIYGNEEIPVIPIKNHEIDFPPIAILLGQETIRIVATESKDTPLSCTRTEAIPTRCIRIYFYRTSFQYKNVASYS